jgi:hypothetical protein
LTAGRLISRRVCASLLALVAAFASPAARDRLFPYRRNNANGIACHFDYT